MPSNNTRRLLKTPEGKIVAAFVVYFVVYVVLSAMGDYRFPAFGDPHSADLAPASMKTDVWQPAGVEWRILKLKSGGTRIQANALGWIFLPLLFFDRQLAHPSLPGSLE